jgi:hypothetical protein
MRRVAATANQCAGWSAGKSRPGGQGEGLKVIELAAGVVAAGLAKEGDGVAEVGEFGGAGGAEEEVGLCGGGVASGGVWGEEGVELGGREVGRHELRGDDFLGRKGSSVEVHGVCLADRGRVGGCWVVAGADDVEGAVEVALDGADGEAGDLGDVGDLHLFEEAEEEDGALAGREGADGLPDFGDLLLGDEVGLGGGVAVGEAGGDLGDVDGGGGEVFPEAEAAGAGVVAGEVEGDADEPGGDGAVGTEAGAGGPGAEEGFLGEGLGGVAVAEGGEEEAVDAGLVGGRRRRRGRRAGWRGRARRG